MTRRSRPINEAPRNGEAILVATGTAVYIAAWRKWANEANPKGVEAWWVVTSKPYYTPLQITVNPIKWWPLPTHKED